MFVNATSSIETAHRSAFALQRGVGEPGLVPSPGPVQWPAREAILPAGRQGQLWEHFKYAVRLARASRHQSALLDTISSQPSLRELYERHPKLFHVPISAFLDRRFSVGRRFEATIQDLRLARARFGDERLARMARAGSECLSEPEPGLRICLSMNEVNVQEGLWALCLRDENDRRAYNLSFGFVDRHVVLVSSVQGPACESGEAKALVRHLTKAAHGLRPPYLLVECLRALCQRWDVRHLLAIDPHHHIKGRWNQRHRRLKFDYRDFWTELGGSRRHDGYWDLPLHVHRRDLADVPSRKRSGHRRRYAMLDQIRHHLDATWPA